jgi:hypothetical protein
VTILSGYYVILVQQSGGEIMSTNEQYCAYIAKDKMVPWLEEMRDGFGIGSDEKMIVEYILSKIEEGIFDWQRGSE